MVSIPAARSRASSGDALDITVLGANQVLITRDFAASRALVWRAWTEPDVVRRWWAGDPALVTSVEVDLRVGGRWRYVMTLDDGGVELAFSGQYREVVPHDRFVRTEAVEGVPGTPTLTTVTLAERAERTTAHVLVAHPTPEARDLHLACGMGGVRGAFERLDGVLKAFT